MFGKKKQPPIRTLVGEGTVIHGELRFTEGLRVDGEVIGDITAVGEGRSILVISERARVIGKVKGGHVIINGAVTGPVSKERLAAIGWNFPGQTEFFAARWGGDPVMAFCGGKLRVVLATWHVPLHQVARFLGPHLLRRTVAAAVSSRALTRITQKRMRTSARVPRRKASA